MKQYILRIASYNCRPIKKKKQWEPPLCIQGLACPNAFPDLMLASSGTMVLPSFLNCRHCSLAQNPNSLDLYTYKIAHVVFLMWFRKQIDYLGGFNDPFPRWYQFPIAFQGGVCEPLVLITHCYPGCFRWIMFSRVISTSLRMRTKITTTMDALNSVTKEIETVWHGGVVEGFNKEPTA